VAPVKPITEAITPAQERVAALIVEIHGKAQTANTETAYTDVVESCRHALAIESKGERAAYAKKLGAWALNRRGQVKADAGASQQALLDFEDALRLDPNLWRAFHNRGVLRAQAGEFDQAFNDFNRCTELNPQFAKAYSNRAALFVQAGDLRSALQDYRRAIELDPDLAVAHQGRGRVCHMLGRLQEALYHFDAAAQLSASDDSHVITSRADLLADIGRYTEAANEYKRAIDFDDQLAHAYRSSAWLLATCPDDSIRDSNLALKQAQQAIRLDNSQSAISLDTLAAAQANAGDFPSAIASLEQAIGISTEQERATYEFRLKLYRSFQPFRTSPATAIQPASYGE
jgi:tetratricopeptide (TPR) repeat protein